MAMARLDLLNAIVRLGRRMNAELPPPGDPESWLVLAGTTVVREGRHPLLRGKVVPTTIEVGGEVAGVLITGPNTGGKTVALKTLGLLTLMAQAGLCVAGESGRRLVGYRQIFPGIGGR